MPRPECPNDRPAEGYVWTTVPAGPEWRIDEGRRCRGKATRHRAACGKPSAAALNRGLYRHPAGRIDSWWAYCPEHMYGKWVEGARVMAWELRPAGETKQRTRGTDR